jgi:hypothetical protein
LLVLVALGALMVDTEELEVELQLDICKHQQFQDLLQ